MHNKTIISIKDEGNGIDEEVLTKIKNYEFVSTRGTANEKGTGLGLSFSRELLEKLGEDFDISSTKSKGTYVTFSITNL